MQFRSGSLKHQFRIHKKNRMDNYDFFGVPREDSGYRTPAVDTYRQEVGDYVTRLARIVLAKRQVQDEQRMIVTR